ncbi:MULTISPECIES: hypothetical protein [Pseudomonas]|uniref:Uncharacterized protein n=1 Tax=Pseudomonas protegens TaxID=380021 RepID=A0A2T6GD81_9PSED|nr:MULTISPECIES: hypothetical protein [Pseudomonas]MCE4053902.1 hypothetical protein [Pseudomonas sp. Au-Pse12]PUA42109.1 hypothetical protein C5U62_26950 [Pseudomonas protegens]RXU63495.1 hypothetical protein CW358_19950 [Pseudomonas protegens]ULT72642.1 hypothetical protein L1O02_09865 [Pseudomonas sp. BC42]BAQ82119.1 hypothetical protein PST29_4230 [Pseudomonas sp. St29]
MTRAVPPRRLGALALLLLAGAFSHSALAHNPMCECKAIDAEQIRCTGGFSDGSGAPGVTLDVIGYDETILVPGKLGSDSTLTFKKPSSEFYVLFDAGPGHVVEIDQADIEAP